MEQDCTRNQDLQWPVLLEQEEEEKTNEKHAVPLPSLLHVV